MRKKTLLIILFLLAISAIVVGISIYTRDSDRGGGSHTNSDRGGVPHAKTTPTTTTTAPPTTQNCYVNGQGKKEVNVATQFGTNDSSIRSALSLAASQGCGVYFTSATFTYNSTLTLNGLDAYGDGATSILSATSPSSSAIILQGTAPKLHNVQVTSPNATSRLTNNESSAVLVNGASSFLVDHVTVNKAASVGVFNYGGTGGSITTNTISNTLADSIHNTHGANGTDIAFNTVNNSGDDMISVVSYQSDGVISHDINIHNNQLNGEVYGRGISVVGGNTIQIHDNSINHTYGAGIYVEAEGSYNTYGINGVTINNNTVRYPAQSIHNVNILVGTYQTTVTTSNVTGSGNNLDRSKPGLRTEGNVSNINVTWFYGN